MCFNNVNLRTWLSEVCNYVLVRVGKKAYGSPYGGSVTGGWGYQEWRAPKPRAYDYGPQGKYLFSLIIVLV